MDKSIKFETERFVLRKFQTGDEKNMFDNYASKDEVTKYLSWKSHGSVENTEVFLNNVVLPDYNNEYVYRWAIVWKETNEVIGCIDVVNMNGDKNRVELGWVLSDDYWGRGIMPEAARLVIKYLFDEGFSRIQAFHNVENKKSGRVMQKVGMTFEATLKHYTTNNDGKVIDVDMYSNRSLCLGCMPSGRYNYLLPLSNIFLLCNSCVLNYLSKIVFFEKFSVFLFSFSVCKKVWEKRVKKCHFFEFF